MKNKKKWIFLVILFLALTGFFYKPVLRTLSTWLAPLYWGEYKWEQITPKPGSFTIQIKNHGQRKISYQPSCSNRPGTDPEFSFFVRPGKAKKLLFLLSGGGACWSGQNCIPGDGSSGLRLDGRVSYVDELFPGMHGGLQFTPKGRYGMLDYKNKKNPIQKWHAVWTFSCTGSVFWGSNDQLYTDPFFNGGTRTIRHRGFDNIMSALHHAVKRFPNVNQVLVSGQSAGGYGAAFIFPYVKEAFPKAQVDLLVDSATGIVPAKKYGDKYDFMQVAVPLWQAHKNAPSWVDGISSQAQEFARLQLEDLYLLYGQYYPQSFIGEYTPAWDLGQAYFFHTMKYFRDPNVDWKATIYRNKRYKVIEQKDWCEWHNRLVKRRRQLTAKANKKKLSYRIFMAPGSHHGIGRAFEKKSNQVPFYAWLDHLVNHRRQKWQNIWCQGDCGRPDQVAACAK